jgi:hypothetical protein
MKNYLKDLEIIVAIKIKVSLKNMLNFLKFYDLEKKAQFQNNKEK